MFVNIFNVMMDSYPISDWEVPFNWEWLVGNSLKKIKLITSVSLTFCSRPITINDFSFFALICIIYFSFFVVASIRAITTTIPFHVPVRLNTKFPLAILTLLITFHSNISFGNIIFQNCLTQLAFGNCVILFPSWSRNKDTFRMYRSSIWDTNNIYENHIYTCDCYWPLILLIEPGLFYRCL